MSIWYIDPVNGSDGNNGTSWAAAWQTITSGATAARIAPGDTIRIAKSPAPVSLGNGTWTSTTNTGGGFPATTNISALANNGGHMQITVPSVASFSVGCIAQVLGTTGTTGLNGTWTVSAIDSVNKKLTLSAPYQAGYTSGGTAQNITSKAVVLATAQTLNVSNCDAAWTAAGSSTVTLVAYTTTAKEGEACVEIAKTSPANSTLYAYKALGSSVNYSGYQALSLWLQNATAILAGQWTLCLCSDAAGATVVDSFPLPAIPSTGQWLPLFIQRSGGGNCGAAIQSIALYSGTSAATTAGIYLDNIIACTTSGLNLQSLISTNPNEQGGTEGWFGLQSIDPTGTILLLDNHTNCISNAGQGYYGTSQTATTYKRETFKTALAPAATTQVQACQKSGTFGNLISYQGGWDTGTNLQTGETFFDGLNGNGYGIYPLSHLYLSVNHVNCSRYSQGYYWLTSTNCILNIFNLSNNSASGLDLYSSSFNICSVANVNNNNAPSNGNVFIYSATGGSCQVGNANSNIGVGILVQSYASLSASASSASNNGSCGVEELNSQGISWGTIVAKYNGSFGLYLASLATNSNAVSVTTAGNINSGIANYNGTNTIVTASLSDSVYFSDASTYANSELMIEQYQGTSSKYLYTDGGYAETSDGGAAWSLYSQNTNRNSSYPLILPIATIYCLADRQVNISATITLSSATDINGAIVCPGGQIAGVSSDVTSSPTIFGDTNGHLVTISFTPTANGPVTIYAEAWESSVSTNNAAFSGLFFCARTYGDVSLENSEPVVDFGQNVILQYSAATANPYITQLTAATVAAYPEFSISGSTITISNANSGVSTVQRLYDWTQWWLTQNPAVPSFFTTQDGQNFTSTYNITVNAGVALTGGNSINVGFQLLHPRVRGDLLGPLLPGRRRIRHHPTYRLIRPHGLPSG